jgi:hypothetical protein
LGRRARRPIVKNKAHFFFSLERQVDNPNRSRPFQTRPDLDFSIAEDRTDWNTLIRFDHQINPNHTWAVRWLREWAPQWNTVPSRATLVSLQDETDLDQTAVGTLTSVFGNSRVNTVRVARTWEHWWHGNACFRAQGPLGGLEGFKFGDEAIGNQALCPPQLNQTNFLGQASTESQGPWDSNYQIEDDYSWFLPGKHGDHDMKFGARYNYTELRRVSQVNSNGTFTINSDLPFDRTTPEPTRTLLDSHGHVQRVHQQPLVRVLRPGQVARQSRTTLSLGFATTSRSSRSTRPTTRCSRPRQDVANRQEQLRPRIGFTHSLDAAGKSVIPRRLRDLLQPDDSGRVDDTLERASSRRPHRHFPTSSARSRPSAGRFQPIRTWSTGRSSIAHSSIRRILRACRFEQRRRDLRLAESQAARTRISSRWVMCAS